MSAPVDDQQQYQYTRHQLHVPTLKEVADLFRTGLEGQYEQVQVEVVDCPDLRQFGLAAAGLSGRPAVMDVGGVPYLVPVAQVHRKPYAMAELARHCGYDRAAMLGAALGPYHTVGVNCELMPNVSLARPSGGNAVLDIDRNETHIAKLDRSGDGMALFKPVGNGDFCLLGNLFVSEGAGGPVIKVSARRRLTDDNFISGLRKILGQHFGEDRHVALGGTFRIRSGRAKFHIMPDFSDVPLESDEAVGRWLRYFEFRAPLTCLTVFHSCDPGLDLRIEHSHGFGAHGEGGHYHYDTTPEEVEYEAYLQVAETCYRFDRPKVTHNIGRD